MRLVIFACILSLPCQLAQGWWPFGRPSTNENKNDYNDEVTSETTTLSVTPDPLDSSELSEDRRSLYEVSLQSLDEPTWYQFGRHIAAGVILNEYYIITTADPLIDRKPEKIQVVLGTSDLDEPKVVRNVSHILYHARYDRTKSFDNNVALVKLLNPIENSEDVQIVGLPDQDDTWLPGGVPVVASGWGRIDQDKYVPSRQLRRSPLRIVSLEECQYMYPNERISPRQLCATDRSLGRGNCIGDEGGALVTESGALVGIQSFGWRECAGALMRPNVYTRIVEYRDWIARIIDHYGMA